MFDSVFVDIAIGIALIFFVVSSMVAAMNEWVTRLLEIRSKILWNALANLFDGDTSNDFDIGFWDSLTGFMRHDSRPEMTGEDDTAPMVHRMANSAMIAPLGGTGMGTLRTAVDHIPAAMFTDALIDLAERGSRTELLTHLTQARAALERATAEVAPDPTWVITGWEAAVAPERLERAVQAAGLSLSLANPITASATAWRAASEHPPHADAALALNEGLANGIDNLSAGLDGRLVTALVEMTEDTPLGSAVATAVRRAGGRLDQTLDEINTWFDTYMNQLSAMYRLAARRILFVAGMALAVLLNVDAIDLVDDLRQDADNRTALVAAADATSACAEDDLVACAQDVKRELGSNDTAISMPVLGTYVSPIDALGLGGSEAEDHPASVVAGWLLTGLAVSLGAPFWFDLMKRLSGARRG